MDLEERVCPDPYPHGSHHAWDGSTKYVCPGTFAQEEFTPHPMTQLDASDQMAVWEAQSQRRLIETGDGAGDGRGARQAAIDHALRTERMVPRYDDPKRSPWEITNTDDLVTAGMNNGATIFNKFCSQCGRFALVHTGKCPDHFHAKVYTIQNDGRVAW